MASEVVKTKIGPVHRKDLTWDEKENYSSYIKRTEPLFQQIWDEHNRVVKSGILAPGFLFSQCVADGKAIYRVESVSPLKLQHVPFSDGYRVTPATIRGLRIADLQQNLKWERMWAK